MFIPGEGLLEATEEVPGEPGVVKLEYSLLELGSSSDLCQGLFYMLPIKSRDKYFLRYMESGCYRGFFPIARKLFLEQHGMGWMEGDDAEVFDWRVFTDKDFSLSAPQKPKGKLVCLSVCLAFLCVSAVQKETLCIYFHIYCSKKNHHQ